MKKHKFSEFFEDQDGSLSATRLAFLLWAIGVLVVWAKASWVRSGADSCGCSLADINDNVLWVLAVLMTGKVVQKFKETEAPAQPPVADPAPAPVLTAPTVEELQKQAALLSAEDKAKLKAALG